MFNDEYYEINSTRLAPSYNISPESIQPIVRLDRDTGERVLALTKWVVEDAKGEFQFHQCALRQA